MKNVFVNIGVIGIYILMPAAPQQLSARPQQLSQQGQQ
jgi:hypothetical protein